MRWLVALLFLTGVVFAQSQQGAPPQSQTAQPNQITQTDKRGTDDLPLAIKIIPTKQSETKASADAKREAEKAQNDAHLVLFTERLFWATVALSVIAFFQLIVFGWQGVQLGRTVDLGREEFASTHRPKIIVYGVDSKLPGAGNERNVNFRYVNIGDTEAKVTSVSSRIQVVRNDRPPAGIELHGHTAMSKPIVCKSGEHGFAVTPDAVSFINLVRSGQPGSEFVFCVGVIAYRDGNDVERLTGFCRRYDCHSERWLQVADHDYEYAY
jgi:hypothetical protein